MALALKRARTQAGLTQKSLMERLVTLGVVLHATDKSSVQRWEAGTSVVPAYVLAAAAEIAGIGLDELLGAESVERTELKQAVEEVRRRLAELEGRLNRVEGQQQEMRATLGLHRRPDRRPPTRPEDAGAIDGSEGD